MTNKNTGIRDILIEDLKKYKNFGTPFTEDVADHIIGLFQQEIREALTVARYDEVCYLMHNPSQIYARRKHYEVELNKFEELQKEGKS